jgi:predicted signal transduction protein with EAL and GGDEF domain
VTTRELVAEAIEENADRSVALIVIALFDLGAISDALGLAATEAVLDVAAGRVADVAGPAAVVHPIGDNRFAVVAPQPDVDRGQALAEELVRELQRPVPLGAHDLRLKASCGVATFPTDAGDAATLCWQADLAARRARADGAAVRAFDEQAARAHLERFELEQELARGIARDELVLRFQPKIEAVGGRLVGVEALVRWIHPARGELPPSAFLDLAEDSGLIVDIDRWVIAQACAQLARWDRGGTFVPQIAVNISAQTLEACPLDEHVAAALTISGVSPHRLELEITETELMTNPAMTAARLELIRALGVRLAVDDFGTGYSSLAYLKSFRFDTLKIDRSFVIDLTVTEPDVVAAGRAIVHSIIRLADGLGLAVVAEGVETEMQRDALVELGCSHIQGYLYSAPISDVELQLFARQANNGGGGGRIARRRRSARPACA